MLRVEFPAEWLSRELRDIKIKRKNIASNAVPRRIGKIKIRKIEVLQITA